MIDSAGREAPRFSFHTLLFFLLIEGGVWGERGSPTAPAACGFRGQLPSGGRPLRPEDDQTASALSVMTM